MQRYLMQKLEKFSCSISQYFISSTLAKTGPLFNSFKNKSRFQMSQVITNLTFPLSKFSTNPLIPILSAALWAKYR